jgi:hypothetical protein
MLYACQVVILCTSSIIFSVLVYEKRNAIFHGAADHTDYTRSFAIFSHLHAYIYNHLSISDRLYILAIFCYSYLLSFVILLFKACGFIFPF